MAPTPDDPAMALNEVLSEVLDLVQDVKQAHRKVPESHELHATLDQLFDDLRSWAGALFERDEALGISPLATIPSVAGRTPINLWPGEPSDDEVRTLLDQHLGRLADHVNAAIDAQDDGPTKAALAAVERGVSASRAAVSHR